MGYGFVAASSQYLDIASAPVTAAPMTISCWLKTPNLTNRAAIVSLNNSANNDHFVLWQYDDAVYCSTTAATYGESFPSPTISTATWLHCAAVYGSVTNRTIYMNAGAGPTDTTSVTPSGINRLSVGRNGRLAPTDYITATIAEVAIWNVALSGADLTALSGGASPMALATPPTRYWRLKASGDLTDLIAAAVLTNTGATWTSDHPTVADPPSADSSYLNPAIAPGLYRPGALMRPHALRFPNPAAPAPPVESWGPVPS